MQEYPKALYKDGVYSAVADKAAEAVSRSDGWLDWQDDQLRMSAPPKVAEPVAVAPSPMPTLPPEQIPVTKAAKPTLSLNK